MFVAELAASQFKEFHALTFHTLRFAFVLCCLLRLGHSCILFLSSFLNKILYLRPIFFSRVNSLVYKLITT
jgi:hypothetical protein